jgi:6-pyruvoyltetrahydropterin/6-carboxytetrahydropterin synthase
MKIFLQTKFSAAHQLLVPDKGDQWNKDNFGRCTNLHGHTWKVEFEVGGIQSAENGMLINFNELKAMVDKLDHKFINDIINNLPTAENLVDYFMDQLIDKQKFEYIRVRVYESENAYAEDEWSTD